MGLSCCTVNVSANVSPLYTLPVLDLTVQAGISQKNSFLSSRSLST